MFELGGPLSEISLQHSANLVENAALELLATTVELLTNILLTHASLRLL